MLYFSEKIEFAEFPERGYSLSIMKAFPVMTAMILIVISALLVSAEDEVWYNAAGEVAKITKAVESKQSRVPNNQKSAYQTSALQALHGNFSGDYPRNNYGGIQRYRTGYAYPHFYQYPRWGHSYRPIHRSYRLNGSYQKNGWSVRFNF